MKMLTLKQFIDFQKLMEGKYIKQISSKLVDAIANELEKKYVDSIMKQEPITQEQDDLSTEVPDSSDSPDEIPSEPKSKSVYNREDLKMWIEKYLMAYYEKGPMSSGTVEPDEDDDSIVTKYGTSVAIVNMMKIIGIPSQLTHQGKKWEAIENFEEVVTAVTEKKIKELGLRTPLG